MAGSIHIDVKVDTGALAEAMRKAVERSAVTVGNMADAFRFAAAASASAGMRFEETAAAVRALEVKNAKEAAYPKLQLTKADVMRMRHELVRSIRFRKR